MLRPCLLGASSTALLAAAIASAAPTARDDIRTGQQLYMRYGCQACHGTSGQGAGIYGPKIAPDPLDYEFVHAALRTPRARMPVYTEKVISDEQVRYIYAYLESVSPAKPHTDIPLLRGQ